MSSFYSKKWYQRWWGVLIIIFLILIVISFIASALYVYNTKKDIESGKIKIDPETGEIFDKKELIEGTNNYYLGAKNPKLTIVMFADLNCPYCKKAFDLVTNKIIKEYSNRVKIIYRDLPI